jgi:hypothetical protein
MGPMIFLGIEVKFYNGPMKIFPDPVRNSKIQASLIIFFIGVDMILIRIPEIIPDHNSRLLLLSIKSLPQVTSLNTSLPVSGLVV